MSSGSAGRLVGNPVPRIRRVPPAATSEGADACFLCAGYGLTADPWQAEVLEQWLARTPGGLWAAAICGLSVPRQNGKNACLEILEVFLMVEYGLKILHTAHEVKTARKAFLRLKHFFGDKPNDPNAKYPELNALVVEVRNGNGLEAIVLSNGGSVEFVARSKGSGRGFTVDLLVLDEAQHLNDVHLEALMPTISAAPSGNPQVIYTGTPPDPNDPHSGLPWRRLRKQGVDDAGGRLCWIEYSIEDGPAPSKYEREHWVVNPALGGRLTEAYIEDVELNSMSDESFARERLGWWGMSGLDANVFGPAYLTQQMPPEIPRPAAGALGVACSLDEPRRVSLGAAGWLGDQIDIGAVQRFEGVDTYVAEVKRIQWQHRCLVVVDGGGPASDLIPPLLAAGVDVTIYGTSDLVSACAFMLNGIVTTGSIVHHGDPLLTAAASGATKRKIGDRWAWGRRTSSNDVSMLEAVTLAAWAVHTNPVGQIVFNMNDLDVCDVCGEDLDREIPEDEEVWLCKKCFDEQENP